MTALPVQQHQTSRYYSTCPVCGEHALQAYVGERAFEIQCGRCGAFEITRTAISAMSHRTPEQRKSWLRQARQRASWVPIALVERANEPEW